MARTQPDPQKSRTINADAIAAAAVAQAEGRMQAARRAAVQEWRDLVTAIADGVEPDGQALQRIAELSTVLKLPPGVLASHVAAVQEDRRVAAVVAEGVRKGEAADASMTKLADDLRAAEARVNDLRIAFNQAYCDLQSGVFVRQRVADHRERYPILFDDLDTLEV